MKYSIRAALAAVVPVCAPAGAFAQDAAPATPVQMASAADITSPGTLETVIVTARYRPENAQQVPVSLSVVDTNTLDTTSTYNTAQITQLVPSLNYSSPNPRNTAFTIRGLGSSVVAVSQANDGLEPGVGFYVDQVYHARPATAAFDLLDAERVEVLRGPQGTLFGKNTTAGAINVVTKGPSFDYGTQAEISDGEYGFAQAKASVTGPLTDDLAARVSFAATTRNGVIHNVTTGGTDNNVSDEAIRGQLLYRFNEDIQLRLSNDYSVFESQCCTQVFFGVGTTLKPAAQQYPALAAGKNYAPPSTNPYARKTDIDASVKVNTNEGGISAIADWNLGPATVTSVSAWRYWNWDAANDRDYTGLSIQTIQHIPSRQDQYSQELRIASNGTQMIDYVGGLYWFTQTIKGEPITQYGPVAAYWLLGPPPANPSNLLDGYGTDGHTRFTSNSYAVFGEATWHVIENLSLTGGLRYTYEDKNGSFVSTVYGGLQTSDPTLINKQLSILRPQSYTAAVSNGSVSGRANASYNFTDDVMAYVTYANGSKSGGINMSGLPLNSANLPALATAVIKPENNITLEGGFKTQLFDHGLLFNIDAYSTSVHNFQTNVVDTGPGALRGYLANIEKVRVTGVEMDSQFVLGEHFSGTASSAWTDGRYASYKNGPCPLELIGTSTTVCDLSGKPLSALPRWAVSLGGEFTQEAVIAGMPGQVFLQADSVTRSKTYGDPSDSKYTLLSGYSIVNASLGFRQKGPWEIFFWAKNVFDRNYMQNLTIQAGNSGLIVGTPDDPREVGVTLGAKF
jgi:iron complex outermembrane recepter protein